MGLKRLNESYRILEKGRTLLLSVPFMYTGHGREYLLKEAGGYMVRASK